MKIILLKKRYMFKMLIMYETTDTSAMPTILGSFHGNRSRYFYRVRFVYNMWWGISFILLVAKNQKKKKKCLGTPALDGCMQFKFSIEILISIFY